MTVPVRYLLILWTFSLSVLLYVDRICISTAKGAISRDLNFNDVEMGWVLSVFALGYALFQTPGGWLADRFGPRLSLTAIVTFWSLFTGLTATVTTWWGMLSTRFLFGAGEAGAFPGVARATYSWIPTSEWGLVQGINFSGSRVGGAVSLVLLPAMIERFGWRGSFVALMGLGFVWAGGWYWWFRNNPSEHPGVTTEELAVIGVQDRETPRSAASEEPPRAAKNLAAMLASSADLWLISAQYFSSNFTFFFCLTWLFPHLTKTYSLSGVQAGVYSAAPLVCGAIGNWFAGWLVDRIYRAGHWSASRRFPAMLGFTFATVGVLMSAVSATPLASIAWFSLAVFGADMTLSPSWAFCIDIGKQHAGIVSGAMNMAGNLGSFLTALAFPYLAAWTGSNTPFFFIAAGLNLLAIPIWMLVDPRRTLEGVP